MNEPIPVWEYILLGYLRTITNTDTFSSLENVQEYAKLCIKEYENKP